MRNTIRPSCGSFMRGLLPRFIGSAGALATALFVLGMAAPSSATAAGSPSIVIAEAYGGGGNSGATYKNDFIVLFNRSSSPVNITGWSVQYASATGTGAWQKTDLTGTIPAGGYYLVQEAAGAGGTMDLPTPDAIGNLLMSGTTFKIALCSDGTLLNGACPTGSSVVDYLGAGPTANCYEGTAPAPAPSNTTSVQRQSGGCQDEDNNATDFVIGAPAPRNSASPINICPVGGLPPSISSQPLSADRIQGESVTFAVVAAGSAPLTYQWYKGATPLTDGARISGATSNVLTITSLVMADAASYTVVVNNATAQPVTSDPATLTVGNPPPVFRTMPVSQTVFAGTTASFSVAVYGVGPFTYRWYKDEAPLSDGGQLSGTATAVLTINNVTAGNAGNYKVTVTGSMGSGSATSDPAALTLNTTGSGILARWAFNLLGMDPVNPPPSAGDATASGFVSNLTNAFQAQPGTAIDPVAAVEGMTNYYWGSASYPSPTVSNKTAGLGFRVSTAGKKNIRLTFAQRASSTASKYTRLQYTTNGTDFIDYPVSTMFAGASTWESRDFDLSGFAGVHNNANFGFRVVSEFESTATYGASNTANYVGITSSYGTSGTLSLDYVTVSGELLGSTTPPTLQAISEKSVVAGSSLNVNFTISGGTASSVEVTPGDPSVASAYGTVSGAGGTITVFGLSAGATPVIVKVTDANGNFASGSFMLTVNPLIPAPVVSSIPATNTLVNTPVTIPFTIGDANTPATALTLGKQSFNTTLVPVSNITFGGSGSNRTATITPVAGTNGTAPIVITVTNNDGLVSSAAFTVLVRPTATTLMVENFDYAPGVLITTSGGYWQTHSGTAGQMNVLAGGAARVSASDSEDVNARLWGAPYSTNGSAVIWSSLVVKFTTLPTTTGAYFAHLKDDTAFNYIDRIFSSTQNAAAGAYRLGVANASGANNLSGQYPMDLQTDTAYTIVTKTVVSNGVSTIWIDPTGPGSTHITATNTAVPWDVTTFALRQATGGGSVIVDSIRVGLLMSDVVPVTEVEPIPLAIVKNPNGSITLNWADPAFTLQESTSLLPNSWTEVNGAASGFTTTPAGTKFYRLIAP